MIMQKFKKNKEITNKQVRIVDSNVENKIYSLEEALFLAKQEGYDLIQISNTDDNAICKIADYGKFIFELEKKTKQPKVLDTKEIKFTPNISENDIKHKVVKAREFIESGFPVKITVTFSGRGILFVDRGEKMLEIFRSQIEDIAKTYKSPVLQGKTLSMIVTKK